MHLFENLAFLAPDLEAHFQAETGKLGTELLERLTALRSIDYHHHVEVVLNDSLGDIENIDLVFGQIGASLGENTDGILAYNRYNRFVHSVVIIPNLPPQERRIVSALR
jgi:hypothetical protein